MRRSHDATIMADLRFFSVLLAATAVDRAVERNGAGKEEESTRDVYIYSVLVLACAVCISAFVSKLVVLGLRII
jgi:hypothetical protein